MGVHGHGVPLAGAPTRRRPWPDRDRGGVRQPVRVSGVPAGGAPARGWACHRLADRGLSRRISTRPRLRVPVARHHPGAGARGLAVPLGRAGAEPGVGLARARRDAGPARGGRGSRHPDRDGPQSLDRQPNGGGVSSSAVIRTYYVITGLFNLAMSLIWGIDTLFKMSAGLDIQRVLLTNAAFTLGSTVFEVPTGVVADTLGRRVSLLLCLGTLFVTTLLYVTIAWRGWGFSAFVWVSVLLGLGYTFYTGAVDAWLVDALKATGYTEPLERGFSRGQMLFGAAMLAGTIGGGLLGQIRLDIPYVVRAALVVPLFWVAWFRIPEGGFTPRALQLRRVPAELRRVFVEGLRYGLSNPVVRPVMFASLVSMSFMIFGFYSWQRYFLDLLGRNLVWVDGVISALVGLGLIVGNALVAPLSRVVRTRAIGTAWAWSGLTLLLGIPLYWRARSRDQEQDKLG